jgi:aromatic ring hydroxylase
MARWQAERVAIECVPCPIGGMRCYFRCPLIGVRCEQLFSTDGIFASRKAHKLTYASQSDDELSRARRKVRKLHRQVEGDFRYARPRGRNRWRIVKGLKAAKTEARALYHDRLRTLVGDLS